ncbi:unnamed protein product [Polarella glacialis]|uniref:Uncharacterized protein n=1 Tax=Polarella glacialis TaxID=89957 RepID=A0A813I1G8_POLGL|nr:unnamed protein product [Polarella glacialis]
MAMARVAPRETKGDRTGKSVHLPDELHSNGRAPQFFSVDTLNADSAGVCFANEQSMRKIAADSTRTKAPCALLLAGWKRKKAISAGFPPDAIFEHALTLFDPVLGKGT